MMTKRCVIIPLSTMVCVLLPLLVNLCSANGNSSSNPCDSKSNPQQMSPYGSCGQAACFCAPGIPGIPGSPGPAGSVGAAGSPGNHGPEGPMGPQGSQGDEGPRGSQGRQGPKGATGPRGPAGQSGSKGEEGARGSQGPPGPKGPQGASGPTGSPGNKGDAGVRGSQGLPGPPGPKGDVGSFVRNWKQCVFKGLSDGRDTGLVKECIFNKTSQHTGLRVFWNGNLRITNCNSCCRRWYFTFNGAECSAPAAIDGVLYMQYGSGAKVKNLHRVRQIEGVCENVHKGTVRVGFWVGNCAGYGSADAATGWNSVARIYVEEVPPPQA